MRAPTAIMLLLLTSPLFAAPATEAPATFSFPNFASAGGLNLVQAATISRALLRLTPARTEIAGAAWFPAKQPVINGFETAFNFQLTQQGGLGKGADGFAFVLQNSGPSAIAGRGAAGGFALGDGYGNPNSPGIPLSIAVFFDTFQNAGDPSANYIAVCTNGRIAEMRWPPPRLAMTRKLNFKLKDGRAHAVRIAYKPPILSVYVDDSNVPALVSTVDFSRVADADGSAYVGFTASTGAGYQNHDILNWSFWAGQKPDVSSTMVSSDISFLRAACLPDKNLCTPDRALVEESGPGQYHVVLPANLEWGASLSSAPGEIVEVANARGIVCWDLKSLGADGCNGPGGNAAIAGTGMVAPDKVAGALVTTSKAGRIYFTVNDRSGEFKDNEGFFEFDVHVR